MGRGSTARPNVVEIYNANTKVDAGHSAGHVHGPGCGHEPVPHGDHVDYLVDGHLHHPHGDHCDDHGPVKVVK